MSINYCTDFICTYKKIDNVDESNMLFRSQYLQAFNLDFFDMDVINDMCEKLFNLMQNYEDKKLNDILALLYDKHAVQLLPFSFKKNTYTNLFTFQILFSYDFFDLFHKCLIDLINTNSINYFNYSNLIKLICEDKKSNISNEIENLNLGD
jgi:hypothetical protein